MVFHSWCKSGDVCRPSSRRRGKWNDFGWQFDGKGGTLIHFAVQGDDSPHHTAKPLADSQSQSGAAEFAVDGGIRLGEFGKNGYDFLLGDADSRIDGIENNPGSIASVNSEDLQ